MKRIFLYTQLLFALNGLYATYICIGQNDEYNGFSVLFTYLIGLAFLNKFLGLKGTLLSSFLFFLIFYFFLKAMNINFGNDESLLCYFFGYSGIIFGFLNESTIRQMKSQKIAKEYRESTIKKLDEQGKSIKNLVENLDQGFMVFDQRGVIYRRSNSYNKDFLC